MRVFISYRRDDSAGYAGRLFDYLTNYFGEENVFMDVATIRPGEDFRGALTNAVGQCDVVLVMIGKHWLNITDAQGRRRLDDSEDWVRTEIAAALASPRIRVIPVLVRDARMPAQQELPEELKELSWRNAIELSDARFKQDANQLITEIEQVIGKGKATSANRDRPSRKQAVKQKKPRQPVTEQPAQPEKPSSWGWAVIVIPVLLLGCWFIYSEFMGQSPPPAATTEPANIVMEATGTASPPPRRTSPPPTLTSTPSLIGFEDTFEDNGNEWVFGETSFSIEYGKLVFSLWCLDLAGDLACVETLRIPFAFPKNFRLEIDATVTDVSGPDVSEDILISFRVRADGEDNYIVRYSLERGGHELYAFYGNNFLDLTAETYPYLIETEPGSTNRLGIELKDSLITPLANGQRLPSGRDDHLPNAGDSYLYVSVPQGKTVSIEFDNLMVQEVR